MEQVADYLKEGIEAGAWWGEMPGAVALSNELRVNHKTVEAALSLMEREGFLGSQGLRRPRRIARVAEGVATRSLRIGMLMYGDMDFRNDMIVEIRHLLHEAGHVPFLARRLLEDIGTDVRKLADVVNGQPAEAWLALAAPMETLEWFAAEGTPVFAMFGRFRRLPVAGGAPDKTRAYEAVVRTLVAQGHRRIVLLARPQHRLPVTSRSVQAFLDAMEAEGITTNDYHCPPWENTREGFHQCLESLFRTTAPTALVIQEAVLFGAVQQFFQARGIRVPKDVSLVCTDPDPTFAWRIPTVAHIRWNSTALVRRVAQWADQIALGRDDRKQLLTKAEFVPGDTIGPVSAKLRGGI